MKYYLGLLWGIGFSAVGMFILPCPDVLAFRCGDGIVDVGDTKSRVLSECGEPGHKVKEAANRADYYDHGQKGRKKSSRSMEKWAYNCGEGDFIYILTFEGGKLIREDTNGRGKGKSQCRGREARP